MVNQRWNYVMASIETEWPELLGGAYDTLNLFTAGKGIGEEAADFLAEMFHPRELLKDSKKRNILISILPLEDAEGLVRSLGKLIDNDESKSYYVRLRNLKYTSKVEDKFLEYFGIEKIQPPEPKVIVGEEFISSWTV